MPADLTLPLLADTLGRALLGAFGTPAFPDLEGWVCQGVALRSFLRTVPVATFSRPGQTLAFIVTPTQPAEPAYKRTPRYDVVYFSEDVPSAEQHVIYARDRAMIDRFAAWVAAWDAATRGGEGTGPPA